MRRKGDGMQGLLLQLAQWHMCKVVGSAKARPLCHMGVIPHTPNRNHYPRYPWYAATQKLCYCYGTPHSPAHVIGTCTSSKCH